MAEDAWEHVSFAKAGGQQDLHGRLAKLTEGSPRPHHFADENCLPPRREPAAVV
jgi:hypothetical protein